MPKPPTRALPSRRAREAGTQRASIQAKCEVKVPLNRQPRTTRLGPLRIPQDCPRFTCSEENVYPKEFPFDIDQYWPIENACEQNASASIECSNCDETCFNMGLQRSAEWPECDVRPTSHCGFGYFAPEQGIPARTVIGPYSGKVCHASQLSKKPKQEYILKIDNDLYVDAKEVGYLTRFINHSCLPNCKVERRHKQGLPCAAVVALRDIAPGEELTFNYGVKFFGDAKTVACKCAECLPPAHERLQP